MIKKILKKKPTLESIDKLVTSFVEPEKKSEHGLDPESPSWLKYVALLTAALAGLAGFLVVQSSTLTNQAIYESDQAILAQSQASDSWSEYQADSIKARIVETQLLPSSPLSVDDRAALQKEDDDLRGRQPQSKQAASDKQTERDGHVKQTQKRMDEKGMLEYASLATQLGIVLGSIAAMVKKPVALYAGFAAAFAAAVITVWAMASSALMH